MKEIYKQIMLSEIKNKEMEDKLFSLFEYKININITDLKNDNEKLAKWSESLKDSYIHYPAILENLQKIDFSFDINNEKFRKDIKKSKIEAKNKIKDIIKDIVKNKEVPTDDKLKELVESTTIRFFYKVVYKEVWLNENLKDIFVGF